VFAPRVSGTLRLTLLPNDVLPEDLSWRILDGTIRTAAWDAEGEAITLGLWGPGDWVTNAYSALRPVEIQCLSTAIVEQLHPSEEEVIAFLQKQIRNTEEIFEINRIRSADARLLRLLLWLGNRFGQVSSRGHRFSLKDMNLTHKGLADICGLTRVTVTKNLNRYKTLGILQKVSDADWLFRLMSNFRRVDPWLHRNSMPVGIDHPRIATHLSSAMAN
jgi:CRP-like cAMP-binding protein